MKNMLNRFFLCSLLLFTGATHALGPLPTELGNNSFPLDKDAFVECYLLQDESLLEAADTLFGEGILDEYLDASGSKMPDQDLCARLTYRGFKDLGRKNILEHPSIPGYVIKLPKDGISRNNIDRIWTAQRLREVIARCNLSHLVIPRKYLYHIPGRSFELSSRNYLVFAEKLDILEREQNALALKRASEAMVQEVHTFVKEANYKDVRGNICLCADKKKIAIIDTENDESWGAPVKEGLDYFSCLTSPYGVNGNCTDDRPITVIVPSYNNEAFYEKNLISLFSQRYGNLRVLYIDDSSTDGTGELALDFAQEVGFADRFTLVRNSKNRGVMYNLYHAIHHCDDGDIIVELDGDDWFAHNQVLATIGRAYQDGAWLTYGNYDEYPSGEIGLGAPFSEQTIRNNEFRENYEASAWCPVRSYYAWLFKQVRREDLCWEGKQFMPMSHDEARMYAMIEMAGERHKYIDEVLYHYNRSNPISDDRKDYKLQRLIGKYIFAQEPYERLDGPKKL